MRYPVAFAIVPVIAFTIIISSTSPSPAEGFFIDNVQPELVLPFAAGWGRANEIIPSPNVKSEFTINDVQLGDTLGAIDKKMKSKYPNARYHARETQGYLTDYGAGIRAATEPYTYNVTYVNEEAGITDQSFFLISPPSSYSRTVGFKREIFYSRESGWGSVDDLKNQISQKWGKPDRSEDRSNASDYYWFRDLNGEPATYNKDCDKIVDIAQKLYNPSSILDNIFRFTDSANEATKSGCWSVLKVTLNLDAGHVRSAHFMTFDNFMFGLSIGEQKDRVSAALQNRVDDMRNKKAGSPKL